MENSKEQHLFKMFKKNIWIVVDEYIDKSSCIYF